MFKALIDKKAFLFIGNPPYATANEAGAKGKHKEGVAKTAIGELMKSEGLGKSSQQLFAQFIWRINKLKKDFNLPRVVIAFFINPIFFSSSEYWAQFRKDIFSNFGLRKGFIFPAGDFADVSSNWGISFIVLDSKDAPKELWNENSFYSWNFDALVLDRKNKCIKNIGTKTLFHWQSSNNMSEWIREPIKKLEPVAAGWKCAQLSSGLKISTAKGQPSGSLLKDSLGYMVNVSNNVYNSLTDTWIVSSSAYKGHGLNVTKDNFERCCVNFAVRQNVIDNWVTHIDEYHLPNEKEEGYSSFVSDAVVFSLFGSKSNQSSVRDLRGKDGVFYSFINQWFPYSKGKILKLADENNFSDMYNEALSDEERFVYEWLKDKKLSKEAGDVLDSAWTLIEKSFPYRETSGSTQDGKNLHTMRWDAGWYQINMLLKNIQFEKTKEYLDFKNKYSLLAKKIQMQIGKFGILKDTFGHFKQRSEVEENRKENRNLDRLLHFGSADNAEERKKSHQPG